MKRYLKFFAFAAAILLTLGTAGCSKIRHAEGWVEAVDYENPQAIGSEGVTVVMDTTLGEITMILFPNEAPKAVENFLTHAENGYYNDLTFHRVIQDFMIQGGDPTGTGSGGESIWGEPFEDEFSDDLHLYPGALCMANSGTDTNGSQFFIVQGTGKPDSEDLNSIMLQWFYNELEGTLYQAANAGSTEEALNTLVQSLNDRLSNAISSGLSADLLKRYRPAAEKYSEIGGAYWLDYKHTVFGQVIKGMNVVDAIAAVETNDSDKPLEDVKILSIKIIRDETAG